MRCIPVFVQRLQLFMIQENVYARFDPISSAIVLSYLCKERARQECLKGPDK